MGSIDGISSNRISVTTTTYDGGTVGTDTVVNGSHEARSVTKNALGKESSITDASQNTITYSYDPDGNLTKTSDPSLNGVQIAYDGRGRKSSTSDPDAGSVGYTYNGFSDVIGESQASGYVTSMLYDQFGRMISKTDVGGTGYWIYDQGQGAIGKLTAMVGKPSTTLNGSCAVPCRQPEQLPSRSGRQSAPRQAVPLHCLRTTPVHRRMYGW